MTFKSKHLFAFAYLVAVLKEPIDEARKTDLKKICIDIDQGQEKGSG